MNTKNILILVFAVLLTLTGSSCGKSSTNTTSTTSGTEASTSSASCADKSVAGKSYTALGTENLTINNVSYSLCCWETATSSGTRKICADKNSGPVGYDTGVLFEKSKTSAAYIKSMETYESDGKSCQQQYNSDGSAGALSCK